jgi:hypothetical protein
MKIEQALMFVCVNGRFLDDAPARPYFVKFPTPYSSKTFFSDDTNDLVEQVLKFSKTKDGKELEKKIDFSLLKNEYEKIDVDSEE